MSYRIPLTKFDISNDKDFKKKAFAWAANAFGVMCCLENNGYTEGLFAAEFECLIACGSEAEIRNSADRNSFDALRDFHQTNQDWLFGFLAYDLKNEIEDLKSEQFDGLNLPEMHFFKPSLILKISAKSVEIIKNTEGPLFNENLIQDIFNFNLNKKNSQQDDVQLNTRFTKNEYLNTVEQIQGHILRGDIFEMNFCQEFFAENTALDPVAFFLKLNEAAQAPFSAFYKLNDQYLACASPERFLKKTNNQLISQPIKGTSRRGKTPEEDERLKTELRNDAKNQSENVMIVDLVRNDLGKSCVAGTVQVTELFGIYSFPTVHQMISTVEGTLQNDLDFVDALKNAFPMGSMTGAPKVRAMQLIEQYEKTKRGLYSGAVGYITPEGDFDFNVVIRSVLYNQKNQYLSFQVGGAIVADSVPEREYEECLVKATGVMRALGVVF